jgi:hypothetical protein
MKREGVSDPELAALAEFLGSIERNANFRQQAFNHNLGRTIRVVKLLVYLGLLRRSGKPLAGKMVQCQAAIRQNFSSSESMTHMGLPTGPMQAAHFLPGQVRIDGRPLWEYVNPMVRAKVEFLFADVEHLPVVFNQADSAAEAKGRVGGLCSALAEACSTMINNPDPAAKSYLQPGRVPMSLLEAAYKDWSTGATVAFQDAISSKTDKGTLPPLIGDRFEGYTPESIAARSTATAAIWNREIAVRVLRYYLDDQQQSLTWAWVLSGCASAIREVESSFKA